MKSDTFERIYPSSGENYSPPGLLMILRIVIAAAAIAAYFLVEFPDERLKLALIAAAAVICGYDIVIAAVKDVTKRVFVRENLVVLLAAILSFVIGHEVEGVVALILLQLSYLMRNYALYRTRKMICEVIEPDRKLLKGSSKTGKQASESSNYQVGSSFTVFEGMAVPVDSVIISGSGTADLSFITGSTESIRLKKGDCLPAGCVCTGGQFKAEVSEEPENSLYRKLAAIMKSGYPEMTETEKAWTKYTWFIVPFALLLSILLIVVLPLTSSIDINEAVARAIAVIAVASPCGILIPIPLTYFSGISAARRHGVVFTNAISAERAAKIKAVVFDKVGTLTETCYQVTDIKTDKMDPATFLKVAAYASARSDSPLSRAVISTFGADVSRVSAEDFTELPDKGVSVTVEGIKILLGTSAFLNEKGVNIPKDADDGLRLHMSVNSIYSGWISFSSEVVKRDASPSDIKRLMAVGVERIAMVSGDSREKDSAVAGKMGIEEYHAECSLEEKCRRIEELKSRIDKRSTLAFTGSCASNQMLYESAELGIMTDGIECAEKLPLTDVTIMGDGIGQLPSIIRVARRTKSFVIAGAIFTCSVKALIIILAILGIVPVWFGMLIDTCASLAVVLNCTAVYSRDKTENY